MGPEHKRLLDLLMVRAFQVEAAYCLLVALEIEWWERDGRSSVFERWFARAAQYERMAYLVGSGKMMIAEDDGLP